MRLRRPALRKRWTQPQWTQLRALIEKCGGFEYARERALAKAAMIEATTARVLTEARTLGCTTERAAEELARRRIAEEAIPGGRWHPGSPAAWTAGQPLRSLRP